MRFSLISIYLSYRRRQFNTQFVFFSNLWLGLGNSDKVKIILSKELLDSKIRANIRLNDAER